MTSTPSATTAGREVSVEDHEPSRPAGLLRLAIVGENADELGLRIAERHGLVATSMDGLMKGRKGRKTDIVKAKAAAEWLGKRPASTGERRGLRRVRRESLSRAEDAPVFV